MKRILPISLCVLLIICILAVPASAAYASTYSPTFTPVAGIIPLIQTDYSKAVYADTYTVGDYEYTLVGFNLTSYFQRRTDSVFNTDIPTYYSSFGTAFYLPSSAGRHYGVFPLGYQGRTLGYPLNILPGYRVNAPTDVYLRYSFDWQIDGKTSKYIGIYGGFLYLDKNGVFLTSQLVESTENYTLDTGGNVYDSEFPFTISAPSNAYYFVPFIAFDLSEVSISVSGTSTLYAGANLSGDIETYTYFEMEFSYNPDNAYIPPYVPPNVGNFDQGYDQILDSIIAGLGQGDSTIMDAIASFDTFTDAFQAVGMLFNTMTGISFFSYVIPVSMSLGFIGAILGIVQLVSSHFVRRGSSANKGD